MSKVEGPFKKYATVRILWNLSWTFIVTSEIKKGGQQSCQKYRWRQSGTYVCKLHCLPPRCHLYGRHDRWHIQRVPANESLFKVWRNSSGVVFIKWTFKSRCEICKFCATVAPPIFSKGIWQWYHAFNWQICRRHWNRFKKMFLSILTWNTLWNAFG